MRTRSLGALLTTFATALISGVVMAAPAHAAVICDQYGSTTSGAYVIMNNRWGTSATQCINTTASGFQITQQDGVAATNGAPTSYPAIYLGCHYGNCSPGWTGSKLLSGISSAPTSVSTTTVSGGAWDDAYDIWLNPTTNVSGVQATEIMVWLTYNGSIQPVGSKTGTASIEGRTYDVWTGNNGQNNVVSYVSQSRTTSLSFDVTNFVRDAFTRGSQYGNMSWYLASIQMGFEPWFGGKGLTVNNFSAAVNTGGTPPPPPSDTQAPTAPSNLHTTSVAANSVALAWNASTDNVGIAGYNVFQNGTQIATTTGTGTTYTASGLAASTAYQFYVRARDAAGNLSANSNTLSVTTSSGGTPPPPSSSGCTATYTTTGGWAGNTQADVTVRNSGSVATKSWTVTWTWGGNQQIYNTWNGVTTQSGQSVRVVNASSNGAIPAGGTTTFGFQASYSGTTTVPTLTCTATV